MSAENYRLLLARFLEEKKRLNPSYSLRAFARNLRISPASLSQMISGKRPVTKKSVLRIAHSPCVSAEVREALLEGLKVSEKQKEAGNRIASQTLELETFRVIANWYHFAILSMTRLSQNRSDPGWVSEKLGITLAQAKSAVDRLKNLRLLRIKGGKMEQTSSRLTTRDDVPDEAIRLFHHQILDKASMSLDCDPVDQREFSCEILAIDPSRLGMLKEEIRKFKLALNQLTQDSADKKERVYSLSIQFFPLDRQKKG